jgi:prepilin-type N-terminal cleavage/methylation domain-containing protein
MHKLKLPQLPSGNNQAGFTIIESLVAVIVLGILMTAIAPTIVLSTATRVQSRRVELATQAAKVYISGVRAGNIPAPPITGTEDVEAPSSTEKLNCKEKELVKHEGYCSSHKQDSYRVFCVDGDGDNQCDKENSQDLIVQAFGLNSASNEASRGYRLGIRVYRADAFEDRGELETNLDGNSDDKKTQSTFTGGIGKRKAPLVEMTTDIGTERTSFQDFCSRLESFNNSVNEDSEYNSQCKQ